MNIGSSILSDLVVYGKYSRFDKELGRREVYSEIVNRNKEMHLRRFMGLENEIEEAYSYVADKKVLPSMRSMQFAGRGIEKCHAKMFNCSFAPVDHPAIFSEIMFLLLCGCGVGYSVQRHHVYNLPSVQNPGPMMKYLVGDSIEGWADAVRHLTKAFFFGSPLPRFDFSDVRPKGQPLSTGGVAPGPDGLEHALMMVASVFERRIGQHLRPIDCHDIICHISNAVLSGGIRRSAMISLFSVDDYEMLTCKFPENFEYPSAGNPLGVNTQRARANNSVVLARKGTPKATFMHLWEMAEQSHAGEPGVFWTSDPELNYGVNPCGEVALRPFGMCNLTELNASDIEDQDDLIRRAKAAAFIGTLQATYTDFHYLRPVWKQTVERDALLGVSMTGIASGNVLNLDIRKAAQAVLETNAKYASILGINPAARTTCVKPSGCQKKDTLVVTDKGILSLDEIGDVNGSQWQEHEYVVQGLDYNHSTKFYVNGRAKTKIIHTKTGVTLECTPNHQYKVFDGAQLVWKSAEDLEVGDMLPYRVGGYAEIAPKNYQMLQNVSVGTPWSKNFEQPELLDEELAWVLGMYFGDGSNHKRGIRISGGIKKIPALNKAKDILASRFGRSGSIHSVPNHETKIDLYFNSTQMVPWLAANGLAKEKSLNLSIPEVIRRSPVSVIEAFLDGYWTADGCTNQNRYTRSWVTVSQVMAQQLVSILRAIGQDCSVRLMPPTSSSWGTSMRYWIQENKGWKGNFAKSSYRDGFTSLEQAGLTDYTPDYVIAIEDGECDTYDIEVPEDHSYVANSYVSHNTASLVLGCSSGIHAWYDEYYLRRMRLGKDERIAKFLMANNPELLEKSIEKPDEEVIVTIPIKAPKNAKTRQEASLDLLSRVKRINDDWIAVGHKSGYNHHNVSCTVSVRDGEWGDVAEWLWQHRKDYSGMSCFPFSDAEYTQAPHETITEDEYNRRSKDLKRLDLSRLEDDNMIVLENELACAGGACELTHIGKSKE